MRSIDAGSCDGCEAELLAAAGPVYDLARFGIELVVSPRHADVLLVTGPVSKAMAEPLRAAYEAMPAPRRVVALGACAVGGGVFHGGDAHEDGVGDVLPVDVFVPGCPPRPQAILHGLLLAAGRLGPRVSAGSWTGPYPPPAPPASP